MAHPFASFGTFDPEPRDQLPVFFPRGGPDDFPSDPDVAQASMPLLSDDFFNTDARHPPYGPTSESIFSFYPPPGCMTAEEQVVALQKRLTIHKVFRLVYVIFLIGDTAMIIASLLAGLSLHNAGLLCLVPAILLLWISVTRIGQLVLIIERIERSGMYIDTGPALAGGATSSTAVHPVFPEAGLPTSAGPGPDGHPPPAEGAPGLQGGHISRKLATMDPVLQRYESQFEEDEKAADEYEAFRASVSMAGAAAAAAGASAATTEPASPAGSVSSVQSSLSSSSPKVPLLDGSL
ncbi:hypothetical protein H696_02215 [Fonticula alba]|uniref:Transmembrane protein n=1 Tax=Fonticula alba TaxID=691883 RepID=A0A058ZBH0_FONAL|nr:hypothetical protein H696_02215 [Fonticula alba]KCV71268.1 hypothetical protein H696_02215 [Fonticula alba]|eukprot:XP_009494391.1 hypothetical protein H696_02215 [Fonticula alba]